MSKKHDSKKILRDIGDSWLLLNIFEFLTPEEVFMVKRTCRWFYIMNKERIYNEVVRSKHVKRVLFSNCRTCCFQPIPKFHVRRCGKCKKFLCKDDVFKCKKCKRYVCKRCTYIGVCCSKRVCPFKGCYLICKIGKHKVHVECIRYCHFCGLQQCTKCVQSKCKKCKKQVT